MQPFNSNTNSSQTHSSLHLSVHVKNGRSKGCSAGQYCKMTNVSRPIHTYTYTPTHTHACARVRAHTHTLTGPLQQLQRAQRERAEAILQSAVKGASAMHKDEGGHWEDMTASSGEGTGWMRDFLTPRQAKSVPNEFHFKRKSPKDCRIMIAAAFNGVQGHCCRTIVTFWL